MAIALAACLLLLATPQSPDCPDAASCRQAALEAASRADFESFHDLAWRAVQKGRHNDPELMALVARAQSLSGRPGDALVMLRRLAQMGVATDAATSEDFRRVRALPGWPDVEAILQGDVKASEKTTPSAATPPSASVSKPHEPKTRRGATDAPGVAATPAEDVLPVPLASMQPAFLAYDGVSRRFIVGDKRENKLVVFDEVFKRATGMVGAESGGFFGLTAVEIDHRRGDLWVANSTAEQGASLHKLQLVSGRVLFEQPVQPDLGPATVVDIAVLPDGRVLLLDAQGRRLLRLVPGRRTFERAAALDVAVPVSLASSGDNLAYVAHQAGIVRVDLNSRAATAVRDGPAGLLRLRAHDGRLFGIEATSDGHRLVRMRLDARGTKVVRVDVVDVFTAMPDAPAITIVDGVVYYVTSVNGGPAIRRAKVSK